MLASVIILLLLVISLQFGKTQHLLTERVFRYLEKEFDVSFHVDAIKVDPYGQFKIQNLLVKDHHNDTLIYVEDIKGKLVDIQNIKNKIFSFDNVQLTNGSVNDIVYPGEDRGSLTILSSKFAKKKNEDSKSLGLKFKNVVSNNLSYSVKKDKTPIVNFNQILGTIKTISVNGPNVDLVTGSLTFQDIYKINYKKFTTHFKYSRSEMSFEKTDIITENSNINLEAKFNYKATDFSDFIRKVNIDGTIHKGDLSLEDVNKIYPHFDCFEKFDIRSKVSGTFNDLVLTDAKIASENNFIDIDGDLYIKNGIKNREDLSFKMIEGEVNLEPLLLKDIVPNQYNENLPRDYFGIEKLNFVGNLEVDTKNLSILGKAKTNIGNVNVDACISDIKNPNRIVDITVLDGFLNNLDQVEGLKNINFEGNITGNINPDSLNFDANVDFKKFEYKEIKLSNSKLDFKINKESFIADFKINDKILALKTNISKSKINEKEEFDVNFDIKRARLSKLLSNKNIYQKNISGAGTFKYINELDTLSLEGVVSNLNIETLKDSLNFNNVNFSVDSKGKQKQILVESEETLNLEANGDFEFENLESLVKNALHKFIPGKRNRAELNDQTLAFKMDVHPDIVKAITKQFWLDDNISMSGVLDAKGDKGVIRATVPSISSKIFKIDSLGLTLDNSNQWINSNISIQKIKYEKHIYEDLSLLGKKLNDTLFIRSNFKKGKIDNRAVFYLTTKNTLISMGIESVYYKHLNSLWANIEDKENKIEYNYKTGAWAFKEISLGSEEQLFEFGGTLKENKSKDLKLAFKKINLSEVLPGIDSLSIAGIASGEVFFNEKSTLLKPEGKLDVEQLKINGVNYGYMIASIKPNDKELGYDLNFNLRDQETQNINAEGEITVNKDNFADSKIDLEVVLNNLELSSLSPLGRNVLSAVRGKAIGDFNVSGKLNDFNSYGNISLKDSGLKFQYLNVDYNFVGDTKISLEGKKFVFNDIALKDGVYNTNGGLSGNINYDEFNNWNLDLRIDSDDLLVLNTKQKEDTKYFGTAFMHGYATIIGPTTDLLINVTGTTLPNTKFVLPLSDVKQIEEHNYTYFKEAITDELSKNNKKDAGIAVSLNIDITKDAIGEVVIDQTSGSSLYGRTNGRLIIDIDKFFNIKMYGDLAVDQGFYNFKYGGVINKPFEIKRGGTISWDGDPYEADLNIEALHYLKANPKVLIENLTINRKIDVDLVTKVTGELFNSKQEFLIQIPNASSNVVSELDFKLNLDKDAKMRQFLSLLIFKNFYDENNVNNTNTIITNTTSEIISSAVTNIFNKDDDKFRINFGYTSGESSSVEDLSVDDQINIDLETEISEKILINGNLGVPVGTKTQTAVVGEVKIEFLMNKEGTLRSSVFNRQNEIQYSEEEQGYTQGIGLSYQVDFNGINEMLEKIGLRKNEQAEREEELEITDDKLFYILPDLL